MVEGNGVDLGSVYGLLLEVAKTVNQHNQEFAAVRARLDRIDATIATMATKAELAQLRGEMRAGFEELRQEIRGYHAAVGGHGIHLSEHEERLDRIEDHLDLPHR